jgi:hypothetical protein
MVPAVQATVETGWPVSQPNTCKHPDDFFIDFEQGIDAIQIQSTIPSLKFTETSGLDWIYGDIRTDKYNVYPYGSQAYETRGNFFAWLDVNGNQGRIDFLGGGATYCSVLVSTQSGISLDAYDSAGTQIATSGWASSNVYTRTFTRLTVTAPAGKTIAYVLIHDTGNFWLMDELCTDANKAVMPVPGRSTGSHSDKFDLVFIPDTDYGTPANIDTWLPTFLTDVNNNIDQRLGAAAPVTGNLNKFNFYYTKSQGVASSHTLPADLTLVAPFADAYVILHTTTFGDYTGGSPPVYGAEGHPIGRSFIHESGHGIFGLADEYDSYPDCYTSYFAPNPDPNIWDTQAACRADATATGWNPDDCGTQPFTLCQGDWWKLGSTAYIMLDGDYFANGWGAPASRRIQWVLDQLKDPPPTESIWLNLHVSSGTFTQLGNSFVIDAPPNYLPGKYDFAARVYSTKGGILGEYGFNDPRRIMAEPGYSGPRWLDTTDFQVVLPYFSSGGRVDLIESATGNVKLSIDISKYATPYKDLAAPSIAMISPPSGYGLQDGVTFKASVTDEESGVAFVTFSIREDDGGTGIPVGFENLAPQYDAATGIATLEFDTLKLPDGHYLVVISATDGDGNSGSITVPYSIRNWGVITLLPKTPNSKAGRTMPVKFTIRVAASVDPAQPFIYNDDLTIKIYATSNPGTILQTSKFGKGAQNYRIQNEGNSITNSVKDQFYITNFKTSKDPMQYTVEIWKPNAKDFLVGSFTFKTTK